MIHAVNTFLHAARKDHNGDNCIGTLVSGLKDPVILTCI